MQAACLIQSACTTTRVRNFYPVGMLPVKQYEDLCVLIVTPVWRDTRVAYLKESNYCRYVHGFPSVQNSEYKFNGISRHLVYEIPNFSQNFFLLFV
jgi:hypothetical protein